MLTGKDWKYSLLMNGDIVKEGDEYYNPKLDMWLPVSDGEKDEDGFYPDAIIGYEYNSDETKPIRRKNIIGYQVIGKKGTSKFGEIHPKMDASFCIYNLSDAMKMLNDGDDWELLPITPGMIEEPTFM